MLSYLTTCNTKINKNYILLHFFADDASLHTENISDTALKETQERVTEARSSQPPRTPSRASRSSSMTTPTKISTRNALRVSTTPNSSKQSTPSKLQYGEKAHELMTISESISEESVTQQEEISKMSSEKYREEQEDDGSNTLQNKIYSSVSEKYMAEEAKHINILEGNKYQANILQVPVTEPSEKPSTIACIDQFSIIQESHEAKASIDEDGKIQQLAAEMEDTTEIKLEEKTKIKDEDIDKIQEFQKGNRDKISIEKENEHIEDIGNIKDNVDIPEIEHPTHVIPDQVDKTCDTELKHKEETIHDDYTVQDNKMDISVNVENLDEKIDNEISQNKEVYHFFVLLHI